MRNFLITPLLIGLVATTAWASDDQSGHGKHGEHAEHAEHGEHGSMNHGEMKDGEMDHGEMNHGEMNHGMMKDGIHTEVTIHSISDGTVNVSHGPIPEIGWPAMTMDLNLLEGADIGDVEAGDEAMMMLEKGEDGIFAVRALIPKE